MCCDWFWTSAWLLWGWCADCGVRRSHKTQRARILKRNTLLNAWNFQAFAWNCQSRLKTSISLEIFNLDLENSHKNRGLVGGSLEISSLAWKRHSFQSRLKISISCPNPIFSRFGPSGNRRVRTIFCSQFWGRQWLRQFYGRLEKCVLSARKTHAHKIPRFRGGGGILGFKGGGWFYFYGREDFSDLQTFQELTWNNSRQVQAGYPGAFAGRSPGKTT